MGVAVRFIFAGIGPSFVLFLCMGVLVVVTAIVKKVPNDCLMCHKEGGKVEALQLVLHKAHYGKGADSAFVKFYQGACLNCHKLDIASGSMSEKSGPKNW